MEILDKLKGIYGRLTGSKKVMTVAAVLGIAGMMMILFCGGNEDETQKESVPETPEESIWTDYCPQTERRLEELLSAIDGVGEVKVMITVSSTEEYIYAQAESVNGDKKEHEYVTVRTENGEEALLKQVNTPVITGVAAVCEGGRSDRVREEIYRTLTAVLDIPPSRIYVAAME
ncbi:MAG: hypothetical protein ACI4J0_09990 [Huintestinicola sp.]|uniref:hypothetical protein n=1 Tax=Huintestinicola sp. TaxID=2981661 RepID=UPI003F0DD18D